MGLCESREQIPDYQFGRSTVQPKMSDTPNYDYYKGTYPFHLHQSVQFHIKNWQSYEQQYQWIKFYSDLESDRQFMQWLYPNFYQSFFNTTSYRMSPKERNLFLKDKKVMIQYQRNVAMFLRFLGIDKDSQGKYFIIDEIQFEQCIYTYTHNQVRIQRLLSSMSVLGHREDALNVLFALQQKLTKKNTIYKAKFEGFQLLDEEQYDIPDIIDQLKLNKQFQDQKNHYVQEDLFNESWVTIDIITKNIIDIAPTTRASYVIIPELEKQEGKNSII